VIVGTVSEIWRYPVKSMAGERLETCTVGAKGIPGDRGWALRDEGAGEIRGAKKFPALMQCTARYRGEPSDDGVTHADISLADGTSTATDAPDVAARLSALVGRAVTLWPRRPASDKAHYRRAQPGASVLGLLGRSKAFRRLLQRVIPYTSLERELREGFSRLPDEPLPDLTGLPGELFEFSSPPGTYFDAFPIHFLTTASLAAMADVNSSARWDSRRFRPNFLVAVDRAVTGQVESGWNGRRLRIGGLELRCEIPTVRCGMTTHAQADLPKDPSVLRTVVRSGGQSLGAYASVLVPGGVAVGDRVELIDS
jgi:uncharacterized protein YcbX